MENEKKKSRTEFFAEICVISSLVIKVDGVCEKTGKDGNTSHSKGCRVASRHGLGLGLRP